MIRKHYLWPSSLNCDCWLVLNFTWVISPWMRRKLRDRYPEQRRQWRLWMAYIRQQCWYDQVIRSYCDLPAGPERCFFHAHLTPADLGALFVAHGQNCSHYVCGCTATFCYRRELRNGDWVRTGPNLALDHARDKKRCARHADLGFAEHYNVVLAEERERQKTLALAVEVLGIQPEHLHQQYFPEDGTFRVNGLDRDGLLGLQRRRNMVTRILASGDFRDHSCRIEAASAGVLRA